jgi:hypothetical protein
MRSLMRWTWLILAASGTIGHCHQNGASEEQTLSKPAEGHKSVQAFSETSSVTLSSTTTLATGTCPSRTANYITHTLPQQCLRTDRVAANSTRSNGSLSGSHSNSTVPSGSSNADDTATVSSLDATSVPHLDGTITGTLLPSSLSPGVQPTVSSGNDDPSSTGPEAETSAEGETDSPLDNAKFLSFEEWKKQNLAKAPDQDRTYREHAERQRPGINNALDGFGEDGEIDIDFSGFGTPDDGPRQQRASYRVKGDPDAINDAPTSQTARSKDAGKTCKERTNYASFDCAATVLKNNAECKSASSVLVENKDSYMLNTCAADNKFFIVELCDLILVDTVVLANYEFFSSIFHHFRVSVSGTYPVKMEKWQDLGTYEARNTREIQAFLIEHPKIWARYLRIEFLTHYGSEYYCPVSLLRVHGTTMLEELRPQEAVAPSEAVDEQALEAEATATSSVAKEQITSEDENLKHTTESLESATDNPTSETSSNSTDSAEQRDSRDSGVSQSPLPTAERSLEERLPETKAAPTEKASLKTNDDKCLQRDLNSGDEASDPRPSADGSTNQTDAPSKNASGGDNAVASAFSSSESDVTTSAIQNKPTDQISSVGYGSAANSSSQQPIGTNTSQLGSTVSPNTINETSTSSVIPTNDPDRNNSSRVPTSTASAPAQPQPSTQESFFKSIHKRLQQLEANSTLSLQYIEEQSRILRDAFAKVEKRQISTTTSFLANLNETVMQELHGFRQAYDQLWQSTVIELEGQREQYQLEMLALSARLTLVADELVWQKRMGIVQSTLLLLCLGLVLFARAGNGAGYLEVPLMQQMMNKSASALGRSGWESPPISPSPESRSPVSLFRRKLWRSVTEPSVGTNATESVTDSRPESKDGPLVPETPVDVHVEPPTPPSRESASSREEWNDDDDDSILDPRESQSGPATPRGTREKDGLENGILDAG